MMINYVQGNIFNSQVQTIVNPVNCVGVMGSGLALEFKKRYHKMYYSYKMACNKELFAIGKLMLCDESDYRILLFPTKTGWREPSKIEYIESGLKKFVETYESKNITSIAFPKLGCGKGGLDWQEVKPIMERYLGNLSIPIIVCV